MSTKIDWTTGIPEVDARIEATVAKYKHLLSAEQLNRVREVVAGIVMVSPEGHRLVTALLHRKNVDVSGTAPSDPEQSSSQAVVQALGDKESAR